MQVISSQFPTYQQDRQAMQHPRSPDKTGAIGDTEPAKKKPRRAALETPMQMGDFLQAARDRADRDLYTLYLADSNLEAVCELLQQDDDDLPTSTTFCITLQGETENDIGAWDPEDKMCRIEGDISEEESVAVADVFRYCALDDVVADVVETMRVKHRGEHPDGTVVHVRVVMAVDPQRKACEVAVYGRFDEEDL